MNSRPKHPVRDYAFWGGDTSGTSMSDNMVFTLGLRHTLALWQRAVALVQFS